MRTWHMIAEWLHCPEGCTDPDEYEDRREDFPVEAEDYDGALAEARQRHPTAALDLAWVEWEPWPGLILEISDYPRWETVHDSSWTGHGYLLLWDCAPVPAGLERESMRITGEQVERLISGQQSAKGRSPHDREPRVSGWRLEGEPGKMWLVHDEANARHLAAKSLADEHASCLAHPRIREIVAGPHEYAPILGLDEHGEVVVVTIGRKA